MRAAALLIISALLVACRATAEPPGPGQLVVTGADGEVTLVDPETGERQSLAEESPHTGPVQPTASRGGEVVAWTSVTETGGAVVKIHEEGEQRDVEVPTFPFFYAFDAGATTLAALGNDPDGEGVALLLVDLGGDDARIVDSDRPYYLDWHPDQATLAVHVGFRELALLDPEEERRPLPVRTGDFQAPAWTADGRLVAVLRSEGATASLTLQATREELVVVDVADGSHETVAAAEGPVVFDVAGDRVAYVQEGAGPLQVVGLDGEERREVTPDDVVALEWSPGGDLLLFHVFEEEAGLVPHVWDGEEVVEYEAFRPTGVFVSQYLPFWSQYVRTITQWAPDGSAFAYAEGPDEATVWVQPREGERQEMGPGVMVTWTP